MIFFPGNSGRILPADCWYLLGVQESAAEISVSVCKGSVQQGESTLVGL